MTNACGTPLPYNTTAAEQQMWQCASDATIMAQNALILSCLLMAFSMLFITFLYFALRPTRL